MIFSGAIDLGRDFVFIMVLVAFVLIANGFSLDFGDILWGF